MHRLQNRATSSWPRVSALGALAFLFGACGKESGVAPAERQASAPAASAASDPAASGLAPGEEPMFSATMKEGPAKPASAYDAARDPLGEPLVVGDKTFSRDDVRRQLVLGPFGVNAIELKKLEIETEAEIARQVSQGADPARFELSEDVVQKEIAVARKRVEQLYEGQDVRLEDLQPLDDPLWLESIEVSRKFMNVFLPANPYEWPETTVDAITAQRGGVEMWEQLKESFDEMKELAETEVDDVESYRGKMMVDMVLASQVKRHLDGLARVKTVADGLPDGVVMEVHGQPILVDDVWPLLEAKVTPVEVEQAKQWLANTWIVRQDLEASGHWVDEASFADMYEAHVGPYRDSPFSMEMVALRIKHFPSMEAYRDWYRIYRSFGAKLEDDYRQRALETYGADIDAEVASLQEGPSTVGPAASTPEGIRNQVVGDFARRIYDTDLRRLARQRTGYIIGAGTISVEVILLSAYDFQNQKWRLDGWSKAEEKAREVSRQLAQREIRWPDAFERYSEFHQPPVPTAQQVAPTENEGGRFMNVQRNDLLRNLGESDYSLFLAGDSVTDIIFFEQEVGKVAGPFKGPYGYYISFLRARRGPKMEVEVDNPSHRELLDQEFKTLALNRHVQKLLEQSGVQGL